MTPEQLDAERARQREYERKRRATMTPEELGAYNAYQRKQQRKRRASLTPKELDVLRAYKREYARKRRATMAPEQLDAQRRYQRDTTASGGESRIEKTQTPNRAASSLPTQPSPPRASARSRANRRRASKKWKTHR
jgi:hypothetical protein